jgi:uncharacterized membrane protein
MQTTLHLLLFLHLTGLVLIAGTTIIERITYNLFWKQYAADRSKGVIVLQTIARFTRLTTIGGILLILSGVGMMIVTKGVFDQFTWFRIKMVIVLLLILNIVLVGRRNLVKLRKAVMKSNSAEPDNWSRVKRNVSGFQLVQLGFLLLIVFLSVFKFT